MLTWLTSLLTKYTIFRCNKTYVTHCWHYKEDIKAGASKCKINHEVKELYVCCNCGKNGLYNPNYHDHE